MPSDRFARVKELLLEILVLPPEERRTYLDRTCQSDPNLRKEVEAILAHNDDHIRMLATAPLSLPHPHSDSASSHPDRIGPYRILRKLGEGGMGVVYEAEQQSPRRPVALKIVRGGAYIDEHQVKLFRREAETLGRLRHPSIAGIYEAGRTEDGQHFFVMELVRGVPLGEYLSSHPIRLDHFKTDIRARLALFHQICDAINHAHQRGIIHRDLKPSNILVLPGKSPSRPGSSSDQTQIKILDFGLARMTDTDVSMTGLATEVGRIQGTLAYMSPEQARGNPDEIDLRSDVYSLGVILYELLTGRSPYDVRKTLIHEAVRVICEEEPVRPSTIERTLGGDLETIALKALEKEPGRRYQSVSALAEDIDRYLTDQPILARPPSVTYQLRKLLARHRGGAIFVGSVIALLMVLGGILAEFGFMAVLVVILVAFGITMSVMFSAQRAERMRADRERDRAVREAEIAARVTTTLEEMLASVDPTKSGRDVTVKEMLDETAKMLGEKFKDQPLVEANLRYTVGKTYCALGEYETAEEHLGKAAGIRRLSLGRDDPQTLVSMRNLGFVIRGQGRHDEAEKILRETYEAQRSVLGDEHLETLNTIATLAALYSDMHRDDEAETLQREGLLTTRRLLGRSHPLTLATMRALGHTYGELGRFDEAEVLLRECLDTQRQVLGKEHPDTLESMSSLAAVYFRQARFDEANRLQRNILDVSRRVRGESHPRTNDIRYDISCTSALQGRRDETIEFLREALDNGYRGPKNWFKDGRLSMHSDPDLASLHGDPEFEAIVEELRRRNEERGTAGPATETE